MNWAMHWGQDILLGSVRGIMAAHGVRGPFASYLFMNLRLLNDQTFENATGVGAPSWTWPRDEQVTDVLRKGIYGFVTGAVADRLIAGPLRIRLPRLGGRKLIRRLNLKNHTRCAIALTKQACNQRKAVGLSHRLAALNECLLDRYDGHASCNDQQNFKA